LFVFFPGKEGQEVRTICIPRFSTTKQIVLVNLDDLKCKLVSFQESVNC